MKSSGKPGLNDFLCVLWRAKMEALNQYQEAAGRAARFGLSGSDRELAIAKALSRKPVPVAHCDRFHLDPRGPIIRCRYFFLETCLLTLPECPGHCSDFLPQGDQKRPADHSANEM